MKPKRLAGWTVLAALILATAASVTAADQVVTFQVPVKLQNLHPDITKPTIECVLLGKDGGNVVTAKKIVPIVGGNYSGRPCRSRST